MATQVSDSETIRLRVDPRVLERLLDQLDAAPDTRATDVRSAPRYRYRATGVVIELRRPPSTTHVAAAARNLTRDGMALVVSQFVYPGTEATVTLRSVMRQVHRLDGTIAWCRYLASEGGLHEVGLRFSRPIDVGLFAPEARPVRILLVDDDRTTHTLIDGLMQAVTFDLTCVESAVDAMRAALTAEPDLILINLDAPSLTPFETVWSLRRSGCLSPIVGLAVDEGAALAERCSKSGCTGYLPKPITREALERLIVGLRQPPLVSSLGDNPAAAPLIAAFVGTLREQARTLAVALEHGNADSLRTTARTLRARAGSYGFESITEEATHVEALAALGGDSPELRDGVYHLIHLCLSARAAQGVARRGS